jgi:hypothetical protein
MRFTVRRQVIRNRLDDARARLVLGVLGCRDSAIGADATALQGALEQLGLRVWTLELLHDQLSRRVALLAAAASQLVRRCSDGDGLANEDFEAAADILRSLSNELQAELDEMTTTQFTRIAQGGTP